MKYKESFVGAQSDFVSFIKKAIPDLFSGSLTVEGQKVVLPTDTDLSYDVKHNDDEDGGSVTFKVSWQNETEEEEEEEEDKEE